MIPRSCCLAGSVGLRRGWFPLRPALGAGIVLVNMLLSRGGEGLRKAAGMEELGTGSLDILFSLIKPRLRKSM